MPPALAWGIGYAIHRETGLPAQVENVDLWLLRGAIAIEGPVVAGRPGEIRDAGLDPDLALLGWRRLYVDFEWTDLIDGRIHLRELALDGARIRLETAPGGGVDLAFLAGLSEPESSLAPEVEPPEATSEPWPFRLDALVLRDVRVDVVDAAAEEAPVEFVLAELSLEELVFEDGTLSLGAFGIHEPRMRVVREFALGAAGAEGAPPEEEVPPPPAAQPDGLRYRIEHLELERAGLTLLVDGSALDVTVAFQADGVTLRGGPFPIRLQVEIEEGVVDLEGRLGVVPLVYQGKLRWKDLPVPLGVLAANPALVSWIHSCRAHGELEIALRAEPGSAGEPAALEVTGSASVDDLELANPGDDAEVALAWKQLAIDLREAVVPLSAEGAGPASPIRVALESVRLVEPRLLYTNPAESVEALVAARAVDEGEVTQDESADPELVEAGPPLPFELSADLVEVVDGEIQYADRSTDYRGEIRDLDVVLEGLRWPGPGLAGARLTARPPKGEALSLSGSLDGRSGALELDLEKLALPPLNGYSEPAGYRLRSGSVSLHTKLRANGTALDARNTVSLHQLEVDALDPGDFQERFGMPLDLLLALLRDPGGKIGLSIPITVEEGATEIGLGSILQSALRQALVGAATSPLKMAGFAVSTLGVRGAATEPLACEPGRATLAEGQEERIAGTAALLTARPGLGLKLRGRTGPRDEPSLAEEILIERLAAGQDLPEIAAGMLARRRVAGALSARGRGEPGELEEQGQALLARFVAAVEVPSARLAELARRRAETARDALVSGGGVEAARLELGEPVGSGEPGVLLVLHIPGREADARTLQPPKGVETRDLPERAQVSDCQSGGCEANLK